jgi:hypothetical protein
MVRCTNKYSIYRKVEGEAAGQDLDGLELIEETPVKNGSKKCLMKFRRKTPISNRTGRAASLLSGQQFHATVSMTSDGNDIDILNNGHER